MRSGNFTARMSGTRSLSPMMTNGVHGRASTTARKGTSSLRAFATALIAAGMLAPMAAAQSSSWTQAGTGSVWNWSTATNWNGNVVANGANNTATFATSGLSSGVLINLDSARTIGSLVFDNPSNTFGWTIQGTNTLTLSQTGGSTISVANPAITATISAPLAGSFTQNGPGTLLLTGNNTGLTGVAVSSGVVGVTSSGGANPLGTGTVTLSGGTLRLGDASGYNQRMVVP